MPDRHNPTPKPLPVLPLDDAVLLPGLTLSLTVPSHSIAAVEAAASSEVKHLVVVACKEPSSGERAPSRLFEMGTQAVLKRLSRPKGKLEITLQGIERVQLTYHDQADGYWTTRAVPRPVPLGDGPELDALHRAVLDGADRMQKLVRRRPAVPLSESLKPLSNRVHQAYFVASLLNLTTLQEQQLLEAGSERDVLELVNAGVSREIEVLKLRQKIAKQAEDAMTQEEREHWLRHQLRAIQDELGAGSPQRSDLQLLRRTLADAPLTEHVREEVERELVHLEKLPFQSPEYTLLRSYLGFVAELPWGRRTHDPDSIESVAEALDRDHYDLKDVKERVLEHVAVMKLNPGARSPVLCFVGPPGVGKTSLGESIARALGRRFARIGLGGIHDEAELRGHRRTYLGAMPGRIMQTLRRVEVSNPLLMLDEIDKVGKDFRGDPASALLEILDPNQNRAFQDNYLNLPFDLSSVFFIATANRTDTIPDPLFDRLEILRLSGYVEDEKKEIAKRFLVPRQVREAGLSPERFEVTDEALSFLIRDFTREAGVRQLNRLLGRLARRAASDVASDGSDRITVDSDRVSMVLGKYRYHREPRREALPPGVATGLAWTEVGGEILYIETVQLPGGRNLILTGHLGKVMRESAETALSCVISKSSWLGINAKKAMETTVHMHVPSGSIPKDGPSAGMAMAVALASLLSGLPVESGIAMTGEVTLGGNILPVGGIKEKLLAAQREGIPRILLPVQNEKDLADLPERALKDLDFHFVGRIEEALRLAIPGLRDKLETAAAPLAIPTTETAVAKSPSMKGKRGGGSRGGDGGVNE